MIGAGKEESMFLYFGLSNNRVGSASRTLLRERSDLWHEFAKTEGAHCYFTAAHSLCAYWQWFNDVQSRIASGEVLRAVVVFECHSRSAFKMRAQCIQDELTGLADRGASVVFAAIGLSKKVVRLGLPREC